MALFLGKLEKGYTDPNFFWRRGGQSYLGWSDSISNNDSSNHPSLIDRRQGFITFYEITAMSMLIAAIAPIAQALLN